MTTFSKFAQEFRTHAAQCRAKLQQGEQGYVAAREVEIIPTNEDGRAGDPVFLRLGKMTGETLRREVESVLDCPGLTGVAVEIGFDLWENFHQYMHRDDGWDYEPRIDHFSMDIPRELILQCKGSQRAFEF